MATATVAPDIAWLADRGLVVGARVGSCVKAYAPFGTVVAIASTDALTVKWDDDTTETVGWTKIAPLGYTVEVGQPAGPTPSQWASAATHLEGREDWRSVRIEGVRYVVLTSGRSGRVYHVRADAAGCRCKWYEKTASQCSHMLAVELAALADELAERPAAPIFERCRACGSLTDGPRRLCDDCAADQARRLDRAARRAA
jgi:hypothetical protein